MTAARLPSVVTHFTYLLFFGGDGDHRDLHVHTHAFPTRRSSDRGAGICPLRGHSNVQGDRTVGITEIPKEDMLARLDARFGISSPCEHGNAAVESLQAMREGRSRACIALGGNIAVAMPDPPAFFGAFVKLALSDTILTKLNRNHL